MLSEKYVINDSITKLPFVITDDNLLRQESLMGAVAIQCQLIGEQNINRLKMFFFNNV